MRNAGVLSSADVPETVHDGLILRRMGSGGGCDSGY